MKKSIALSRIFVAALINKHEETIESLHERNTETLVNTMESHNAATKILDRAMDFFTKGENDHVQ